ncbi:MAG: SDR family oxidoreductase [Acidobacteriaceae bacterium]
MRSLRELMSLTGRTAVVTGGAGHLGRCLCETLAELGADIAVLDIAGDRATGFASDLETRYSITAAVISVDLTNDRQIEDALKQIIDQFGGIDVLVNNAAYNPKQVAPDHGREPEAQSMEQWKSNLALVLDGTFAFTAACLPLLRTSDHASIINIGSIYGLVGPDLRLYAGTQMLNPAWYAVGKGGIAQLTRYLATTLAPGIRVNCIAPGGIWRSQPESFHTAYKERTPLRRMATEEDMKGAIAFLASDSSAYVTGQILAVDGGWTAW